MTNSTTSERGRIWLTWDPVAVRVIILLNTRKMIHCSITIIGSNCTFLESFAYGENDKSERKILWNDLAAIHSLAIPWMALGEFNYLLYTSDKLNFGRRFQIGNEELADVFMANDLTDLDYSGAHFTWNNQQMGNQRVACKLDRIDVNSHWSSSFPNSVAQFGNLGLSDHSPGILCVDLGNCFVVYPFKFKNYWVEEDDFGEVVRNS